jgi:hypothetical protein
LSERRTRPVVLTRTTMGWWVCGHLYLVWHTTTPLWIVPRGLGWAWSVACKDKGGTGPRRRASAFVGL